MFAYKTVNKLSSPGTFATTMGTLVHLVLERLFDAPRSERTLALALALIEPCWGELLAAGAGPEPDGTDFAALREWKSAQEYATIVPPAEHGVLFDAAAGAVTGYFAMENPQAFDPFGRELEVEGHIAGVPMRGIIDRLDRFVVDGEELYLISDYKSGRRPAKAFEDKAFFGMKVYALLAKEQLGIDVVQLRLIYTTPNADPERTGGCPEAVLVRDVTPEMLAATRRQLAALWVSMLTCAETGVWPATPSVLCGWCDFQDRCPAFSESPLLPGLQPTVPARAA